jgi:hypothetical protein
MCLCLCLPIRHGMREKVMSMRLDERVPLTAKVTVSGMDADGKIFEQSAETINITTTGAQIAGLRQPLYRGCIVNIQYGSAKARFRVRWVGDSGSVLQGNIGVQLIDRGKFIWGRVLPRVFEQERSSGKCQTALSIVPTSE